MFDFKTAEYDSNVVVRILAEKNLVIVTKENISSGYIDTKTAIMYVPAWMDRIPVKEVSMAIRIHELGHLLFTPLSDYSHSVLGNVDKFGNIFGPILNIFEDIRIEHLIKNKFPGAAKEFRQCYEYIFLNAASPAFYKKGEFSSKLDRINILAKYTDIIHVIPPQNDELMWISRARECKSFDELLVLALSYAKLHKKENTKLNIPKIVENLKKDHDFEFGTDDGNSIMEKVEEEIAKMTNQSKPTDDEEKDEAPKKPPAEKKEIAKDSPEVSDEKKKKEESDSPEAAESTQTKPEESDGDGEKTENPSETKEQDDVKSAKSDLEGEAEKNAESADDSSTKESADDSKSDFADKMEELIEDFRNQLHKNQNKSIVESSIIISPGLYKTINRRNYKEFVADFDIVKKSLNDREAHACGEKTKYSITPIIAEPVRNGREHK